MFVVKTGVYLNQTFQWDESGEKSTTKIPSADERGGSDEVGDPSLGALLLNVWCNRHI